jgi:hypothetical protein
MFNDLITERVPPHKRAAKCDGPSELHLSEGAVMIAFAMHLLRTVPGLSDVAIHPDGEHGKRFDFRGWLEKQGFEKKVSAGGTTYGGTYLCPSGRTIVVDPSSRHRGDVIARTGSRSFVAECKGGIINTRHSGQQSRLRQGLCETVGLSLASPSVPGRRQFAVVPLASATEKLASRMAARAHAAGVEIALVDARGNVFDVKLSSTAIP